MTPPRPDPTAERLAAALLAVFFALFGWFTLWQGGITLSSKKGTTSFVDGWAGVAAAALAFALAALGLAMLLRSLRAGRAAWRGAALALLAPPLLFVLWQHAR